MNEDQILRKARALMNKGTSIYLTARALRVHYAWLRRRIDPEFRQQLRDRAKADYSAYTARVASPAASTRGMTDAELRAYRAATPPDTRDFTARYFGDPEPWRSALAMKGGAA
jgi:hypothetical protein